MVVKKARVLLRNETTVSGYVRIYGCDATVYEKTDGNYKEIIARIHDKYEQAKNPETGETVYEDHPIIDSGEYSVYPNTTLEEFYQTIGIEDYTLTYTEPLTTI